MVTSKNQSSLTGQIYSRKHMFARYTSVPPWTSLIVTITLGAYKWRHHLDRSSPEVKDLFLSACTYIHGECSPTQPVRTRVNKFPHDFKGWVLHHMHGFDLHVQQNCILKSLPWHCVTERSVLHHRAMAKENFCEFLHLIFWARIILRRVVDYPLSG